MSELSTVAAYFWRNVALRGDAAAFLDAATIDSDGHETSSPADCQTRTWRELAQCVVDVCDWFAETGLKRGDHVATCLPNGLAWIAIDIACQSLGLVHVAIDVRETPSRIEQRVKASESVVLIAHRPSALGACGIIDLAWAKLECAVFADVIKSERETEVAVRPANVRRQFSAAASATNSLEAYAELAAQQSSEQPALMLFTSGTLGQPKGVLLSHGSLVSNADAKLYAAPQRADDLRLNVLPFTHGYARTCELSTWVMTAGRLMTAENWYEFLRMAPIVQPTLVNLVPQLALRLYRALQRQPGALGTRLRLLQVGGAALPAWLWHGLASLGLPPLQGYGLTEAGPVVCSNRSGTQQPDCVGPPVQGVEIRIDHDRELWVRSPGVMLGYYHDNNTTREMFRDGWLRTGDLAEWTQNGAVKIIGRRSQQIVLSTGYKVSPECIESRLLMDEALEQVVVVGDHQPALGALVVLTRQGLKRFEAEKRSSSGNLASWCLQRFRTALAELPSQFWLRRVFILPSAPLASSGAWTAKGTLVRSRVLELYAAEIETMFAGELPRDIDSGS